jgi:mono/diheme cytochrome c family protein
MNRLAAMLALLLCWVGLRAAEQPAATPAAAPASVDFTRDIRPILARRCFECHGPAKARGRLRLDVKAAAFKGGMTGPAVVAHKTDESLILRRVRGLDGEDRMPLDEDPLGDAEIALL